MQTSPSLFVFLIVAFCTSPFLIGQEQPSTLVLLRDFPQDWEKAWNTKLLFKRGNQIRVIEESGNKVLRVHSISSASGMFHETKMKPVIPGTISWAWKIKTSLKKNNKERTKAGDDYAARAFCLV